MELLAIAVIAIGTLGKGFDEVMPHNDNGFLVKTIFSCFWWTICFSLNLMTQNGLWIQLRWKGQLYWKIESVFFRLIHFFFGYSLNWILYRLENWWKTPKNAGGECVKYQLLHHLKPILKKFSQNKFLHDY
jgi:hypothetical protein